MPLKDIHHVAIKTQDLDATNTFYADVLGMSYADRPEFDFPGSWFNIGGTMVHIMAEARDFDDFKNTFENHGLDWRQFSIPPVGLWQLFVHDPNGVLIELNFAVADEPKGAVGPDASRTYIPGEF